MYHVLYSILIIVRSASWGRLQNFSNIESASVGLFGFTPDLGKLFDPARSSHVKTRTKVYSTFHRIPGNVSSKMPCWLATNPGVCQPLSTIYIYQKKKHPQPEQQMRQIYIYSSTLNPKTNQNQPLRKHPAFNAIYTISINVYQISTINPTNSHTSTTKK